MKNQDQMAQRRVLHPLPEAREILGGIGHTHLYQLVKNGQLRLTKVGRRSFVAADEIQRFVGSLPTSGGEATA